MKIGILTFHGADNYGSVLQTYALTAFLNMHGVDAETLDYNFEYDYRQYNVFRTYKYKSSPKAFVSDCVSLIPHLKRRHNFSAFRAAYFKLSGNTMSTVEELSSMTEQYDAFICGSDQIWNLDCTNGVNDAYFLRFVHDKRKIAYAPSMGSYSLKEKDKAELRKALSEFDAISVRERSMIDVLQQIDSGIHAQTVLDPTMLLTAAEYNRILPKKQSAECFIFVYILGGARAYTDVLRCAHEMAKQRGCHIRYVIDNHNGMQWLHGKDCSGCSPIDFLTMIRDAECILTNSFHATVFSILFHKDFAPFGRGTSNTRITDLLKTLELDQCFWPVEKKFHYMDSYERTERILAQERKKSKSFLENALGIAEV